MHRIKAIGFLFAALLLLAPLPLRADEAPQAEAAESFDLNHYIFGHIGDAYEWHITTIRGKHISIPLPCIVFDGGLHVFSSHKMAEHGYTLNEDGKLINAATGKRPLDISITKNVCSLIISSILLLFLVLYSARWYKRHDAMKEAPRGLAGLMEMLITMVTDDIIKEGVGKDWERYAPYLLTAFFFIFLNNLLGIVPFFPGGANLTGNIAVTLFLAVCTFLAVNLFGNKHYYKDIFWPDVPSWLKVPVPLMPLIEIIGIFTKPFSLMVRLFANILAGHIIIMVLMALIFIIGGMYGAGLGAATSVISIFMMVFMTALECLVAYIQAYVFTMLSSIFIGMAQEGDDH